MRRLGWVVLCAGLFWFLLGADNMLNDTIAGWRFNQWEMATRSMRENGLLYCLPGAMVVAVGTIILVREWWKNL